jgi:hypothetical protein
MAKRDAVAWFRRNETLSWIGLAIGILSVGLSTVTGALALGVVSGLIVGILVTGLAVAYFAGPPLICRECTVRARFTGVRGKDTTRTTVHKFEVRRDGHQSFTYALRNQSGQRSNDEIKFRTIRNGEADAWHTLHEGQEIFPSEAPDGGRVTVRVMLPSTHQKGDILEFEDTSVLVDSFSQNGEYIGKNIIHPTDKLSFDLVFEGCEPTNGYGQVFNGNLADEGRALQIKQNGTTFALCVYVEERLQPSQAYRVSWRWK